MLFPLNRQHAMLTAIMVLASALAHGADQPVVTVSGYGTAGAVHSTGKHGDFVASILKARGAGATRRTSFDVDSRLAAQFEVSHGKWSAVLQLVSEQTPENSFKPFVEWGNIKYQLTPDVAVRAGRIALPMFLAADYRRVGFAHPWVRTPVELYGTIPITNSDGVDITWRWTQGGATHLTQGFYGSTEVDFDSTSAATARDLVGFAHTVTRGALTARLSAVTARVSLDLARPLFDAYRQFGPAGNKVADDLDSDEERADAISLGVSYDPGQWFLMGEVGRLNTRSFIGDKTAFYLSAGYRTGSMTPYVTYARSHPNMQTAGLGLPVSGLPPQQAMQLGAMNRKLDDLMRYLADQETTGVGIRWDMRDNVAVKLQYDYVKTRGNSYGTMIRIQPGFQSGRAAGVTSAVVDFVF